MQTRNYHLESDSKTRSANDKCSNTANPSLEPKLAMTLQGKVKTKSEIIITKQQ
jgi:hypothetical protein